MAKLNLFLILSTSQVVPLKQLLYQSLTILLVALGNLQKCMMVLKLATETKVSLTNLYPWMEPIFGDNINVVTFKSIACNFKE